MAYGIKDYSSAYAPKEAFIESPLRGERALTADEQTEFLADVARRRDAGTLPDDYLKQAGLRIVNNPKDGTITLMKEFDDLKLTENEAKWARENSSEARDRAYRNGDMDTVALRAMLEYARSGASDARSVDEIKKLAWRLRRNRDIAAARRAADRLRSEGVRDASWERGYMPTTVAMLQPTVVAFTPSASGGMNARKLTVREAMLNELNEASRESGYSPEMRARAAYLAERYGFKPVMQAYDRVVTDGRFAGQRIQSNVPYMFDTGMYRLAADDQDAVSTPAGWRDGSGTFVVMNTNPARQEQNTWNRWAWSRAKNSKLVEATFNRKYRRRGGR